MSTPVVSHLADAEIAVIKAANSAVPLNDRQLDNRLRDLLKAIRAEIARASNPNLNHP